MRYRPDDPLVSSSYSPNSADLSLPCESALTDLSWPLPSSNASQHPWLSNIENWQPPPEQSGPALIAPPEGPHDFAYPHVSTAYTPEVTLALHLGDSGYLDSAGMVTRHSTKGGLSPHSENSDSRRHPPAGPSPVSDQTRRASSMSVGSSQPGVSPTQARSEEPPRDAEGNMFCSHVDCLNQRRTFQRKCEWRLASPPFFRSSNIIC